jgi:hypothetical protein
MHDFRARRPGDTVVFADFVEIDEDAHRGGSGVAWRR